MTHDAYVHKFTAAGDVRWRAQCRTCLWHGVATGDRDLAEDQARGHGGER